jgi:hypothetical protein
MRQYFTTTSVAIMKKVLAIRSDGKNVEKLESFCIASGNVKQCRNFGKQSGIFSKV